MLHSYSKRSCWRQTRVSRGPKTIFQLRSLPGHRSIGQNMLFGWISQRGIGFDRYVLQMLASILPWFDCLNVTQIFSTFIMICATAIDLYSTKNLILVNKTKKTTFLWTFTFNAIVFDWKSKKTFLMKKCLSYKMHLHINVYLSNFAHI